MEYEEFREIVGDLDIPTEEQTNTLISADNSIHFCMWEFTDKNMQTFIDSWNLLISRNAIRGKDYIIVGNSTSNGVELILHALDNFLCPEDFDKNIPYVDGKNINE